MYKRQIITAYCYYALLRSFGAPKWLILLSFALLTLSVGYTKIITQIAFSDMTQIMFLMAFLLCAKKIYDFAESKGKIALDSANRTNFAESKSYIYIYIYIVCPALRELRYLSQRSFIYFN